jgi:molybdenum-dependent DNA-binding transcriptional regulator ModE
MADVITRFKLETSQYDSKLRDATKGLAQLAKDTQKAGGDMNKMSKEQVEAARSLGKLAGGATNAKEKVRELVNAYNKLAKEYNDLSEKNKQSDFAKAMSDSMNELKGRIRDAKQELYGLNEETGNVGGVMGMLRDKLTFNIDALKLFNAGLAASKMALQVAGDALMSSEELVDEWGRNLEAGKSVYEGFLNAINNGDISGFLSRIDQIVQAARTAYDEMDRLGTMKTIQSPQFSKQEAENNRMRLMLMTGRYIAPAAGSGLKPSMENGALLSPGQIKGLEQKLQNGMKSIVTLTQNELKQTGKAINAYYDKLAKQNGIAYKDFLKGTSSMAEYDKRVAGARKYQEWQFEHSTLDIETGRRIAPRTGNPFEQYKGWDVFRVDKMGKNSFNDLVGLIRQQQQQSSQLYSTMGQAYRTINRVEGITPKNILSGGGGGGGGHTGGGTHTTVVKTEEQLNNDKIQELARSYEKASEERRAAIREEIKTLQERNKEIQRYYDIATGKVLAPTGDGKVSQLVAGPANFASQGFMQIGALNTTPTLGQLQTKLAGVRQDQLLATSAGEYNQYEELAKALEESIKKITGNDGDKKEVKLTDQLGNVASGLSGVVGGMEQLGIEVPKGMKDMISGLQSIIGIVNGITTILTAIEAIQAADTLIPFRRGGIVPHAAGGYRVPGNDYADMTPIMVSSGELILNKAQQGNLLSQMQQARDSDHGEIVARLSGEDILLVANRHLRRTGKGELVTWKS